MARRVQVVDADKVRLLVEVEVDLMIVREMRMKVVLNVEVEVQAPYQYQFLTLVLFQEKVCLELLLLVEVVVHREVQQVRELGCHPLDPVV